MNRTLAVLLVPWWSSPAVRPAQSSEARQRRRCDQGVFGSWGLGTTDLSPYRYHQGPGQIDKLWILDVDGELAVMDIAYYEGTPRAVIDELEAIVESTTFG